MDGSLPRCGSYHPRRRRDAAALGFILLSDIVGITSFLVGWRMIQFEKFQDSSLHQQLKLLHKIQIVSIQTELVRIDNLLN